MGIKQPTGGYIHPSKRKRASDVPATPASAPVVQGGIPIKKKREKASAKADRSGEASVLVRLVVYPPAPGQLLIYDQMIGAGYSSKQALLGLLKKGFPQFETDLLNGRVTAPADPLTTSGKPVDTTRNVSAAFIEKAKAIFDPFDLKTQIGQSVENFIQRRLGLEVLFQPGQCEFHRVISCYLRPSASRASACQSVSMPSGTCTQSLNGLPLPEGSNGTASGWDA